jgi:hypothetical protein
MNPYKSMRFKTEIFHKCSQCGWQLHLDKLWAKKQVENVPLITGPVLRLKAMLTNGPPSAK